MNTEMRCLELLLITAKMKDLLCTDENDNFNILKDIQIKLDKILTHLGIK